ncbi:MAG: hypothetical protein M3281_03770 [Chloroflexota bacterium]|nr:hypothetical protein [Chloroflexota bacterium]
MRHVTRMAATGAVAVALLVPGVSSARMVYGEELRWSHGPEDRPAHHAVHHQRQARVADDVRLVRKQAEPRDDHGGLRRHAEPGDDAGGRTETRSGDDRGGRGEAEPDDDRTVRGAHREVGDDHGQREVEVEHRSGDDHGGRHGGDDSGRHGDDD